MYTVYFCPCLICLDYHTCTTTTQDKICLFTCTYPCQLQYIRDRCVQLCIPNINNSFLKRSNMLCIVIYRNTLIFLGNGIMMRWLDIVTPRVHAYADVMSCTGSRRLIYILTTRLTWPVLCCLQHHPHPECNDWKEGASNQSTILNAASLPLAWQIIAMLFYLLRKWIVQTDMPVGRKRYTMHCIELLPPSLNTCVQCALLPHYQSKPGSSLANHW